MLICVTRIENKTDKFGEKKILHTDKGETYKVNKTNKVYDYVMEPGKYEVNMGEFKGHSFIQSAKLIEPLNIAPAVAEAKKVAVASGIPLDRVTMEMSKQQEIKLQCYAGIAKEIAIHNATMAKCEVKMSEVMSLAKDMLKAHDIIIDLHKNEQLPAIGKPWDEDVKVLTETFNTIDVEPQSEETEYIEPPM